MKIKSRNMLNKFMILYCAVSFSVLLTAIFFCSCTNDYSHNNQNSLMVSALKKCDDKTNNHNLEKDIVKRFLTYVSFNTQSNENAEKFPSNDNQIELAKYIQAELETIGLINIDLDTESALYSTLPASIGSENMPTLALICHLDTDNTTSAEDIHTIIVEDEKYNKITTDGKTLLGGDNKAGIAEVVCMLETLASHPEYKHPEIRFVLSFDEEIGESANHIKLDKVNAKYAYTVDGLSYGEITYETWNAATAKITMKGTATHLGEAYQKMKNPLIMSNEFISLLPENQRPESTKDREGFISVSQINGDLSQATFSCLIRDFEKGGFQAKKDLLKTIAAAINSKYGEGSCILEIKDTYPNMKEFVIPEHQYLIDNVKSVYSQIGAPIIDYPIRGGTDGSTLSANGLPCPNLGAGTHDEHSVNEYVIVEEMQAISDMLVKLVEKFA